MCYSQGADREKNIWEENLDPDSSGDFLSKYFCICKETSFCLLQLQWVFGPSCGRCKNHQFASALSHPMGLSHLPLSLLTLLSPASLQFLTKQSAARCETNHQNLACSGFFLTMATFRGQVCLYGESAVGCVMSVFSLSKSSDTETILFLTSSIFCQLWGFLNMQQGVFQEMFSLRSFFFVLQ